MTLERLKDSNKKVLAKLARDQGVVGWHAMRKDQLIRALAPPPPRSKVKAKGEDGTTVVASPLKTTEGAALPARLPNSPARAAATQRNGHGRSPNGSAHGRTGPLAPAADPSTLRVLAHGCAKDRIITMVRDAYWLHAYWELSRSTLSRAQAALGQEWHSARPILRVMDVSSEDTTSASERHVRDIEIHGGVNNWFIDVSEPPRSFRIDIGYLSKRGKFYVLARSNVVSTPKAGATDMLDQNWLNLERDYERMAHQSSPSGEQASLHEALRELFEDRLKRPMNTLPMNAFGTGAFPMLGRKFHFEIGAELVVYGTTEPCAKVTLQGEVVPVRPDGTFSVRFSLPDARQIIPAVATSADGVEERTIVLAVERNTKELEPMIHDGNEL
jgi:hypothetical protein